MLRKSPLQQLPVPDMFKRLDAGPLAGRSSAAAEAVAALTSAPGQNV